MSFENKPNDKKFARKGGDKKREFVKRTLRRIQTSLLTDSAVTANLLSKASPLALTKSLIRELQSTSMFHTPVSQHSSCVWCTPF